MNILVTGANGFIGKNLCERLKAVQEGKDRSCPELKIERIFRYTRKSTEDQLETYCANADFVFHLAGVNRPEHPDDFERGNKIFTKKLIQALKKAGNSCPVLFSSSIQATLGGKYEHSAYGKSKLDGENLLFQYGRECGAQVLVYRLPNLFGKWCRPMYNSVIATFCYNIARDLPIEIHDPATVLELLYIDDLTEAMLKAICGDVHRCRWQGSKAIPDPDGSFCYVPETYAVSLGEIVRELERFHNLLFTMEIPPQIKHSFQKKLYATYLSYLPEDKISCPLKVNKDARGSFTELIKSREWGQISVNITKPGMTKGRHWHNTKWEIFIVVAGHGLIRERKIGSDKIIEFEVTGEKPDAVCMLPGYTHSITNLSATDDLITVMWANEAFDPEQPDTFSEEV